MLVEGQQGKTCQERWRDAGGADEGADTSVLMGSGMKESFDSPTSLLRL